MGGDRSVCIHIILELRLTNVLKLAHGWQNDEQYKELFNENNVEYECPAGCRKMETKLPFV